MPHQPIPSATNPWAALRKLEAAIQLSNPRNAATELQRLLDAGLISTDHVSAANRYLRLRRLAIGHEHPTSALGHSKGRRGQHDLSPAALAVFESATRAVGDDLDVLHGLLLDREAQLGRQPLQRSEIVRVRSALDRLVEIFQRQV